MTEITCTNCAEKRPLEFLTDNTKSFNVESMTWIDLGTAE